MVLDAGYRFAYGRFRVVETFQPSVEVDVLALKVPFGHAAPEHLLPEMPETHVAGATARMRDHHYLLYSELVDGHDQAPHGGVPWRRYDGSGILDDLCVAVFEAQGLLQEN